MSIVATIIAGLMFVLNIGALIAAVVEFFALVFGMAASAIGMVVGSVGAVVSLVVSGFSWAFSVVVAAVEFVALGLGSVVGAFIEFLVTTFGLIVRVLQRLIGLVYGVLQPLRDLLDSSVVRWLWRMSRVELSLRKELRRKWGRFKLVAGLLLVAVGVKYLLDHGYGLVVALICAATVSWLAWIFLKGGKR